MEAVTDNVSEVLEVMMQRRGFTSEADAAKTLVRDFRAGKLGRLVLDDLSDQIHVRSEFDVPQDQVDAG